MRFLFLFIVVCTAAAAPPGARAQAAMRMTPTAGNDSIKSNMPAEATAILTDMLTGYYLLKDGLAGGHERGVQAGIISFASSTARLDTFILVSSSGYYHLWGMRDTLKNNIAAMQRLKDETFARRRLHFRTLSATLFALFQKVQFRGVKIYRLHDPAAFNKSGAYWLSAAPEILSPYTGRPRSGGAIPVDSLQ